MVAAPAEDTPRLRLHGSWPLKVYEAPRIFDRKAENQPYIHWVKGSFGYVEESSDEEDVDDDDTDEGTDEEDDEHSDAPVEQKGEKTEADEQKGERKNEPEDESHIECLQAYFDYFDKFSNGDEKDDKPPEQIEADSGEDREIKEPSQRGGIAKVFMAGMTGDHLNLPYRDQVEVVVGFAEQETSDESQTLVALLDDMKSGGIISAKPKRYKPQGWNLNLDQLRAQLSKQRFKIRSGKSDASDDTEGYDLERRILFLPDLSPSTMEVVLATAPRNHALALKNFFYKYLTGKAAIGVTIPSRGFKIFTFDLHIPFYVLMESEELRNDSRKGLDGKALRKSLRLPFLSKSAPRSSVGKQCLYESQISVTVTGIDHQVWTAYGSFDTYYGSNDSVEDYRQTKGHTGRPDPLTAGQLNAYNLIWTPREYFFKVFETRITQVTREWRAIADKVEDDVKQSRPNHNLPLNFDDLCTRQEVREFSAWSRRMVTLLRSLRSRLGDTIDAWDKFQRKDIGYFLFDEESPTSSSYLKALVDAVDTIFSDLKDILRKLQHLEKELCQDSPQGLNAHYNHGNHEAQLFQQKSARHIQILTVITILYLPLALASNVFSTTPGVLPFTPNFGRFVLCFFLLGFLVVASILALFNWRSWIQRIVNCLLWMSRKAEVRKDLEQGPDG